MINNDFDKQLDKLEHDLEQALKAVRELKSISKNPMMTTLLGSLFFSLGIATENISRSLKTSENKSAREKAINVLREFGGNKTPSEILDKIVEVYGGEKEKLQNPVYNALSKGSTSENGDFSRVGDNGSYKYSLRDKSTHKKFKLDNIE